MSKSAAKMAGGDRGGPFTPVAAVPRAPNQRSKGQRIADGSPGHKRPISGPELMAFARMVRICLAREAASRSTRIDSPADLEQDVVLAVLTTHAKTGKPLTGNRTYYFKIARRRAFVALSARVWSITMTDHAYRMRMAVLAGDPERLAKTRGSAKTAAAAAALSPVAIKISTIERRLDRSRDISAGGAGPAFRSDTTWFTVPHHYDVRSAA